MVASSSFPPLPLQQPTIFELVCARVVVRNFAAIVLVLYRPGSQQKFYDELVVVLDSFAAYQMPIYVVGDFNVRLDRRDDPHATQLRLLADGYGLVLHDTGPIHQLGKTLDAVITHNENGRPAGVTVADVGLSDHLPASLGSQDYPRRGDAGFRVFTSVVSTRSGAVPVSVVDLATMSA